jgi:hypothetical protein
MMRPQVERARWWRARARAIVHCTLDGLEGRPYSARRLRRELQEDFDRHARLNAPRYTRKIWREVVARACACGGLRTVPGGARMKQLPLFEGLAAG